MPNYELVYIVSPNINEDALPEVIGKVADLVKKTGGNVTEVNQWGRKKLTYPIKKFYEGNYIFAKLDIESTVVKKIDASLKMNEDILRYLITKESAKSKGGRVCQV